jgi:hypothetical protein
MTVPNEPTLPLDMNAQKSSCCALCGADAETASGFLNVPVVTPWRAVRVRLVCDACLSLVLSVSMQLLSSSNKLGARVIAVQDGTQE